VPHRVTTKKASDRSSSSKRLERELFDKGVAREPQHRSLKWAIQPELALPQAFP
jgi:hypothetical protein